MIITIGRQHGSGGHDIARLLAEELGVKCYGKEILDEAANNSNFSREVIKSYDEKRVSAYIDPTPHFIGMNEGFRLSMQVATAQFTAIRNIADNEDCIFVGRCADYVLRERKDVIKIFILGDMQTRIETIMKRQNVSESQAKKTVKMVDKDRSSYYKYYTDQVWGESENYDLSINSSRIGTEGAVKVIKAFVEAKKLENT